MEKYRDRMQAGQILAEHLSAYENRSDVIVLALPRGGVPVGFEIAKALHVPLDIFVVRKLGVPGQEEVAMGAIAAGGVCVFNEGIVHHILPSLIESVITTETRELKRREIAYRSDRPFPLLKDKIVILVDDGIATGATIRAGIKALRTLHPKKIVVAVPVADESLCEQLSTMVEEFVCPLRVPALQAVGFWYEHFSQTEDDEVKACLEASLLLQGKLA